MKPKEIQEVVKEVIGELAEEARRGLVEPVDAPSGPKGSAIPPSSSSVLSDAERKALRAAFSGQDAVPPQTPLRTWKAEDEGGRPGAFDDPQRPSREPDPAAPVPAFGLDLLAIAFACACALVLAAAAWIRLRG